jgi:uncharacterized protein
MRALFFALAVLLIRILPASATEVLSHALEVTIDPANARVSGSARLTLAESAPTSIELWLGEHYQLDAVQVAGKPLALQRAESKDGRARYMVQLSQRPTDSPLTLAVRWSGSPPALPADYKMNRNEATDLDHGYISLDGAFLPQGSWYPTGDQATSLFRVTAKLPEGWRLVAPGKLIATKPGEETYDGTNPLEGLDLVTAPWSVMQDEFEGQRVAVYSLPGTPSELSNRYLLATIDYLKRFTREVGPHPWPQYLVVEHILPTGYGMPSFTLLGGSVMRLPFIIKTSLGHEVLHDWWGNGVYVDRSAGNWCEGLTAYMADHRFSAEELKDDGKEYRTQILRDYAEYASKGNDIAVAKFTERHDFATRAIGYGKVAMIFHMLKLRLGQERFDQAMRQLFAQYRYRKTSWSHIQELFSQVAQENLNWFFEAWLQRPGAPVISVGAPQVSPGTELAVLRADLKATPGWRLDVPVQARSDANDVFDGFASIDAAGKGAVRLAVGNSATRLIIDPQVDLFRRLAPDEIPATLARYLAAPPEMVVIGTGRDEEFQTQARAIAAKLASAAPVRRDLELNADQFRVLRRVLWIGQPSDTVRGQLLHIPPGTALESDRLTTGGGSATEFDAAIVLALDHPSPGQGVVVLIDALRPGQLESTGQRVRHYGKYSYLLFSAGTALVKGTWPAPTTPLQVPITR